MKRFGSANRNGGLREGKGSVSTESRALEKVPRLVADAMSSGLEKPTVTLRRVRHEAVCERLQEAHQRSLLSVREAEPSHALGVDVVGGLRRGPTRRALTGVIRRATRERVSRVVDAHKP
jgi:hypothetical protein